MSRHCEKSGLSPLARISHQGGENKTASRGVEAAAPLSTHRTQAARSRPSVAESRLSFSPLGLATPLLVIAIRRLGLQGTELAKAQPETIQDVLQHRAHAQREEDHQPYDRELDDAAPAGLTPHRRWSSVASKAAVDQPDNPAWLKANQRA